MQVFAVIPQRVDILATPEFAGLTLVNAIDEFSTDGTMGGNSDSAVPTEAAVVTYVAGGGGGGIPTVAFKTITGITNDVVADAAADTLTLASTDAKLTIVGTAATDTITFSVIEGQIDHDNLSNFTGNEHIDHTSVTLTAGTGLTGGGDISANRSFAVDGVLEDLDTLGANSADSEFLVGTGAGALAWENAATALSSLGLTATAAELNVLDGVTAGTVTASKAVVVDVSKDIGTFGTVTMGALVTTTIGAFQATGAIDFNTQAMTNVDINSGTIDGISSLTSSGDLDIGGHTFRAYILTADSLPAERVVFTTTNGALTGDADFTWDGTNFRTKNIYADNISGDDITGDNLTLTDPSQDWKFLAKATPSTALFLQSQEVDQVAYFNICTDQMDDQEVCAVQIYGTGGREDTTNYESLLLGWIPGNDFWIYSSEGGSGTVQNIEIYCEGSANQLLIMADGGITMATLKSGANQGAAGAAANELWVDTADQTIKLGT